MAETKAAATKEEPTKGVNEGIDTIKAENEALKKSLEEQSSLIDQIKTAQHGADQKVAELLKEKKALEESTMTNEQKLTSTIDELKTMVQSVQAERDREATQRTKLEALNGAGLDATYANLVPDSDIEGGVKSLIDLLDAERKKAAEEMEKKLGKAPQSPGEVTDADLDRFRDDLAYRTKVYRESQDRYRSLMNAIKGK